ncbi:hypothetical protein [Aneurinibacillus uraniidurans]|uniref:hypothetical protein n=1 Tax=Aneurinibacillus uraniidurans TaxID=2966586 RepID=UPI00234AAAD8|nr:hypothetical protein [Aneurinibacillus sp. B1]WCN39478.1 hypothetical protein PO771_08820 [Aneurinibacillus sp. B1]
MKKFIGTTIAASTLVLAPVSVFADSIAEIKALAAKEGLKVTETSTQITITKPTTPTKPNTAQKPQGKASRIYAEVQDYTVNNITKNKLAIIGVFSSNQNSKDTFNITQNAKWTIEKGAPFTIQRDGTIIATKNGAGNVFIEYDGKKIRVTLTVTNYEVVNKQPTYSVKASDTQRWFNDNRDYFESFELHPQLEKTESKTGVKEYKLLLDATYSTSKDGKNTYTVTDEATWEVDSDAPFTLGKGNKIIPTKNGQSSVFVQYKYLKRSYVIEIKDFQKINGVPSCTVVLK